MKPGGIGETLGVWANVYKRIRFFSDMYPLRAVLADAVRFPLDYFLPGKNIACVRNLTVAVTHKCNIRCEMCYFHKELGDKKELPLQAYQKVVDALARSRPCVILSGGEPFMHPNLVEMAAYAKNKGLAVQIFTNGTMAKPEIVDRLVALGLNRLNVTLLGDAQVHPLVANSPNSYRMLVENLEYAAAHRGATRIMLNYTITPRSIGQMWHAVELARRFKLDGVRFQHYNFLSDREFAAQDRVMRKHFGLEGEANEIIGDVDALTEAPQILDALQKRLAAEAPDIPVQWAPTLGPAELANWYSKDPFKTRRKCLYPWRGVLLDADAKIYPCSKIYMELGDASREEPLEIWNNETMKKFRERLKKRLFPACSRCCKL